MSVSVVVGIKSDHLYLLTVLLQTIEICKILNENVALSWMDSLKRIRKKYKYVLLSSNMHI